MAKFFKYPFGTSGDKTAIPDAVQPSGAVSYSEGFGFDYERDYPTDPLAKPVPREQTNELFYQLTLAMQQYQTMGFPDFITTSDNGGTPYPYAVNATVRYNDGGGFKNYYSLVDANTSLPTDTTKWGRVVYTSGEESCVVKEYYGSDLPVGYVWANGLTIGNASSGATARANADTVVAFTRLWNSTSNVLFPIQNSDGSAGTRGISAAADYAANKRLPLPNRSELLAVGRSGMGGISARGLVTELASGVAIGTLGASGGVQVVSLTGNQNGVHSHAASSSTAGSHSHNGSTNSAGSHNHGVITATNGSGTGAVSPDTRDPASSPPYPTTSAGDHIHTLTTDTAGDHSHAITVDNSGLGAPHQNMPPVIVCNYIFKL